jgi:ABC-type dipeptide/oligopeptide/nickel transport system permease subunit
MSTRRVWSEAYLDIVWRQFRKDRAAYVSLVLLAPMFLAAIFAPLLASNQPLVFRDGQQTIYPWLRALFNPGNSIDYVFNMALLGFVPWVVLGLATSSRLKRQGISGPYRALLVAGEFAAVTLVLSLAFLIPGAAPLDRYYSRSFPQEEFQSFGQRKATFVFIPFGPTEQDTEAIFRPPLFREPQKLWRESNDGVTHWLGTDGTGQDVLARMLYGARVAMSVGFMAVGLYVTIGVVVGAIAGYFGGVTDMVISRIIEIVLLFPSFFLILILVAMLGPSILIIMFVIGITGWPTVARLIRGEVLKQRALDYVQAARALGASHSRILFRHVLFNAISPALVAAPFGIASAIVTEASLSLLGFGVRPPTPTWGALLHQGNANYHYWWLIVVPSLAIFFTVTIFNLVGAGLRDAMDPRLRI